MVGLPIPILTTDVSNTGKGILIGSAGEIPMIDSE